MKFPTFSLSAAQLLERLKATGLYEPLIDQCEITPTDGLDVDRILLDKINDRYASLLHQAPTEILPAAEIAPQVAPVLLPSAGVLIALPDSVIRPLSVRLVGWSSPASFIACPQSPQALAQLNPFSRASADSPVAIINPDNSLSLFPAPDSPIAVASLTAIIMPQKDTFLLTAPLLAQISI